MGVGARIGSRVGALIGARVGAGRGGAPTTTTHTVSVADSADPVITGGDAFFYTVQYTNTGGLSASTVSVVVTLDASLTYVSASGTGWTIGRAGQVVTCTRATVVVGAAPPITINVTTGGSAVSASTTAAATASNVVGTANGSQGTTVNLVTKDATKGWYFPATNTEYNSLITRKSATGAAPGSLFGMQDASGGAVDANGVNNLAQGGTPTYQAAVAGFSRKGISFADNSAQRLTLVSGTGVSPATTSQAWMGLVSLPAQPGSTRIVMGLNVNSGSNMVRVTWNSTGTLTLACATNTATTTNTYSSGVHFLWLVYDRANSRAILYTELEKLVCTYSATVFDGDKGFGSNSLSCGVWTYGAEWTSTNAENLNDAAVRTQLQAIGVAIPW